MLFTLAMCTLYPRGVFMGILGGDVPPGYPNPDPISGQNMLFSTPFSDLAFKMHTRFQTLRWFKNATLHVLHKTEIMSFFLKIHF